ncbi:Predicted SAM-dependent methyltransferase [Prochlorococcus marinus str. MIT 9515]|uniref:tRNA (guanine-N(7)-)-methyltransferase n=1 Tax=Prochlorococcus marinus (strain MIT 9515) TaxID=167542 RepID=TRMB_PROM5|nr:tRNA (guanosine(46)-N7)-methyltransferase TrmB [Prochlorococcus marinus]A2BUM1.1 RecName: Full=tRNA (guanine-N(7)-)-methyltransferase; AltName: Full=tRNA (guanine(46)-N(7))-methyltransferase; AltName: Full=tRNA(m7G46)-methyltransferase [Prochlorococcus marinus str. MIT 9515]ABM71482.1 Predicted SAM-dependent methyltransferase [Prochlorococcus marinus str. MIT 9515]
MRQHVNPLSKNFFEIDPIPPLNEVFENPQLPLHLDIGCASGDFLMELSLKNKNWNYIGIEIREKLVLNANLKIKNREYKNVYFSFGNAINILNNTNNKTLIDAITSISFYFPDPWFKKKHHKRRVIQPEFINLLSNAMRTRSLIFIKTDVQELFEYMELTILESLKFKKLAYEDFRVNESFNPIKTQTKREKYVLLSQFEIYESIYIRI